MNTEIAARDMAAPLVGETNTVRSKLLYSKPEAAEMLSVSPRTVDNLIANGKLVTRRIGSRVLIPYSNLVQFAKHDHATSKKVQ